MATYTTTFAGDTIDAAPTGWTSRWNASTTHLIKGPTDAEDDRVFEAGDGSGSGWEFYSYDAVDGDANRADGEVLMRFRVGLSANNIWQITQRGSGNEAGRTGYQLRLTSGQIQLRRLLNGTENTMTSINLGNSRDSDGADSPLVWYNGDGNPPAPGAWAQQPQDVWMLAKFRVNGTGATVTCQGKVWIDGTREPDDWTVEAEDTLGDRITAAGWIGVSRAVHVTNASTQIDYFTVGTNGDSTSLVQDTSVAVRNTATTVHAATQEADPRLRNTATTVHAATQEADPRLRNTATTVHAAIQDSTKELTLTAMWVSVAVKAGPSLGSPKLMVIT